MLKNIGRKHRHFFVDSNEDTEPADICVTYKDEMCVLIAALCHELSETHCRILLFRDVFKQYKFFHSYVTFVSRPVYVNFKVLVRHTINA